MAIWAIEGYDNFYGGLHGMIDYKIFEGTQEEANARGLDMSYEVIEDYSIIVDALEDDVKFQCEQEDLDYDEGGKEVDDIRTEIYGEDTAWNIYQLDKSKLPTLNFHELENMFYNNPDGFLEKYAVN